jgi:hypothetical protein
VFLAYRLLGRSANCTSVLGGWNYSVASNGYKSRIT